MNQIKKLLAVVVLAVAATSFNIKAKDNVKPIAYVENAQGEWIVLTDYWRKELCAPGTYVAYARVADSELSGCWMADDENVILAWLPNYTIVEISRDSFTSMSELTYR